MKSVTRRFRDSDLQGRPAEVQIAADESPVVIVNNGRVMSVKEFLRLKALAGEVAFEEGSP